MTGGVNSALSKLLLVARTKNGREHGLSGEPCQKEKEGGHLGPTR